MLQRQIEPVACEFLGTSCARYDKLRIFGACGLLRASYSLASSCRKLRMQTTCSMLTCLTLTARP